MAKERVPGTVRITADDVRGVPPDKVSAKQLRSFNNTAGMDAIISLRDPKVGEILKTHEAFYATLESKIREIEKGAASALGLEEREYVPFSLDMLYFRYGEGSGALDPASSTIQIKQPLLENPSLRTFKAILHENIHRLSKINFRLDTADSKIKGRRVGYETLAKGNTTTQFQAFNEGITELYANSILRANWEDIKGVFSPERMDDLLPLHYDNEIQMVSAIIEKYEQHFSLSPGEGTTIFTKAMFTGDKVWMRKLDKAFGPGFLAELAALRQDEREKIVSFRLKYDF